ncbi:hypothetical protein [Clostridium luticellarii]|uniref:hypothetical protein n=1 Tax=Clostridium luticellarii TaxID=1691940 RepID=UPI0023574AD6|nr:hypothetical protein [Clostridium luticellarii]MCI1944749.1 hypothetical protein [Clostridium luticellarii]MCI1968244.1 hypothetical protein [Clostridium luticellarii]
MRSSMWIGRCIEYLLAETVIVCIVCNIFPAFNIDPGLSYDLKRIILCSAVPLLLLYLCFFSKKSSLISLVVWTGILAACIIIAANSGIFSNQKQFEYYYSFYAIILITAVIVFICSKFKNTLLVLFTAVVVIFSGLTILAYKTNWLFLLCFIVSITILTAFKFYRNTVKISHSKESRPFNCIFVVCIFCFVCIMTSVGIFNVVQAGNLPVHKLSVLSNPTFLKIAEKYGFATLVNSPEPMQQPKQSRKNQSLSHEDKNVVRQKSSGTSSKIGSSSSSSSAANQQKVKKKGPNAVKSIRYLKKYPILLIILISILVILILSFLLKKLSRTLWYQKLLKTDHKHQIIQLYNCILKILSVFGYKRIAAETPFEFSDKLLVVKDGISFEQFDFGKITNTFVNVNYGRKIVNGEDYKEFISFYKNILSYCRKDSGIFKFLFKYLFI